MEILSFYKEFRQWGPTGLHVAMNAAEREDAWLNAGIARTDTEKYYFLMGLMKINMVVIDGRYCRQYF